MMTKNPLDFGEVSQTLHEDLTLRSAQGYRIRLAQDDLNFRDFNVTDPVPLGRQILTVGGIEPHGDYSLFAILPSGDFEDVRLDEPFDLREKGAERFVAFQTDRDFKLMLNDQQIKWGKPAIGGATLYALANIGDNEAVFLDVRGGEDRLIEPTDLIDLNASGIERFITAPMPSKKFEITINSRPREVDDKQVTFEQIVQLAFPGPHETNVVFSITYRHAASMPHAGELGAGGNVEVKKKGTVFNVTRTIQS